MIVLNFTIRIYNLHRLDFYPCLLLKLRIREMSWYQGWMIDVKEWSCELQVLLDERKKTDVSNAVANGEE